MTPSEIVDLLAEVAARDYRRVTETDVATWTDAAHLARWTYDEALNAVRWHYAHVGGRIEPDTITNRIRWQRAQPPRRARPALRSAAASDEHRAVAMADIRATLAKRRHAGDASTRPPSVDGDSRT